MQHCALKHQFLGIIILKSNPKICVITKNMTSIQADQQELHSSTQNDNERERGCHRSSDSALLHRHNDTSKTAVTTTDLVSMPPVGFPPALVFCAPQGREAQRLRAASRDQEEHCSSRLHSHSLARSRQQNLHTVLQCNT